MTSKPTPKPGLIYGAIGLLSAAVLAFQLILMQVFSMVQWYHFAYMIISIALLGFGAAGTFLSLFENRLLKHYSQLFPLLCLLTGMSMPLVVYLSGMEPIRFDLYLLFNDGRQVGRLLATYLLFFTPFFLGALAIGLTFVRFAKRIDKLYFFDLFGSGLSAIGVLLLMWFFFPEKLLSLVSLLPILAGVLLLIQQDGIVLKIAALVALGITGWYVVHPPPLVRSEYKSLSKALLLPDAEIDHKKSSPYGVLQVVKSPVLRYAPGLSLNYPGELPARKMVFENGDALGPVLAVPEANVFTELDYTTNALPYILVQPDKVLILAAGTGESVVHVLANQVREVTMVEPNSALLKLFKTELAAETDSLLYHPALHISSMESRSFLLQDSGLFDLIVLPSVSTFGGTSGMNAIQEQYTLTREAFRDCWRKLSPRGMISISSWMDYPPRYPLKILATLVEMLEAEGVEKPGDHLLALRSWGTLTFVVRNAPFTLEDTQKIRSFGAQMGFDPFLMPGLQAEEREQYNQLQDSLFFQYVEAILSSGREGFYRLYDFNIRPATDQRPYFSQFLRWKSMAKLSQLYGNQGFPFLEIGYLVVVITLIQVVPLAAVFILLPLVRKGYQGGNKRWIFLYFSGIGLGYLSVEIVFIQQFTLFFGQPIFAAAGVISCLLIASGIGSYFSSKWPINRGKVFVIPLLITFLLLGYAILLPLLVQEAIGLPLLLKLILFLLLLGPIGFIMGIPFPAGIAFLEKHNAPGIPWAWGINGFFSVISTVLATIIAVEVGFIWVMVLAATVYGGAALANP